MLIEEFDYKNVKHFRVLDPNNLKKFVVEKKNKLQEVTLKIDELLPSLIKKYHTSSEKPGVYYYDGIDGLISVYNRILKEKKDLKVFVSNFERDSEQVDKILSKQIVEQNKIGIKVKGLSAHEYSKESLEILHNNNSFPKIVKGMNLDSEILIFGDNVSITTFKKDFFTTHIINKQIAQTIGCIFDLLYQNAAEPVASETNKKTDNKTKSKDEIKIKINYSK